MDIGSGLNFKRKNFNELLDEVENDKIGKIVIAHKDRFVRFGFDWFYKFCEKHNCKILVINDERLSPEEEIIKDLVSIVQMFSSKVYGLRKYKKEVRNEKSPQNKTKTE